MPLVLGKVDNGFYKLLLFSSSSQPSSSITCNYVPCGSHTSNSVPHITSSTCVQSVAILPIDFNKTDVVWHYRLGHIFFSKMKHISAILPVISSKQSFPCPIYPLARQARLPFPDSPLRVLLLFN